MNKDRLKASKPQISAWVRANAGAGKTHLLVARVLRLLLADTPASRILCVTYTRAAAAEMRERILGALSKWVTYSDKELRGKLTEMCGEAPTDYTMERARALFAEIAEAPDGLRIDTLHALCQSLLKRFPLEAGVAPYFSVIDDRTTRELLHEAAMQLISASANGDVALAASVPALAARMSETSFHKLLQNIAADRRRLVRLLENGPEAAIARTFALLHVSPQDTEATLAEAIFTYTENEQAMLRSCAGRLLKSSKPTDQATGKLLDAWLAQPEKRQQLREDYVGHYHTAKGEKTAQTKLFTKEAKLTQQERDALLAEQDRAHRFDLACRALRTARLSEHLITVADALLVRYEALKEQHAVKDYDDLVHDTVQLLGQQGISGWVMYKLDEGIEHVLVDESQDTSPEQWAIARALTSEFFAGEGRSDKTRTIFAVGDIKQSIYRFQGARPELFDENEAYYKALVPEEGWTSAELPESFRSVKAVLDAVDAVFARPEAELGLHTGKPKHLLTEKKEGVGGLVEWWPLMPAEKEKQEWQMPMRYVQHESAESRLAVQLADTIHGWIRNKEMLASKGRPLRAGDIMILVRKRGDMAGALLQALRRRGVPVAGADRLVLSDSLAVKDLLALGQFLVLRDDDMALAGLLKCPLFAFSEEDLFHLAAGRTGQSLWERLQERRAREPFAHAHETLFALLAKADYSPPFELYAHVLDALEGRAHFAARFGETVHELLDEFLSQALAYEKSHTPSLQGFLHWMTVGNVEVRRDMDQGRGEVRIMTVHAAKGLQAPVVILPDAGPHKKSHQNPLLWHEDAAGDCLLWSPAEKDASAEADAVKQAHAWQDELEERRLLYVAMTRAEDRLYVCGVEKQGNRQAAWHTLVSAGLKDAGATEVDTPTGRGLRLECPQTQPIPVKPEAQAAKAPPMPDTLRRAAPQEDIALQPLSPSRLWEDTAAPPALSPAQQAKLFRRGTLLHTLLQHLPPLPDTVRKDAGLALLARHGVEEADRAVLVQEVLGVLDTPQYAGFFGPDSMAEVPLSGMVGMEGKRYPVAGQADRLAVTEEAVWVLDYKTHASPPATAPLRYVRQMAAYRALLLGVYPGKKVRCALLWTAGPSLMELPEERLAVLCQPLTEQTPVPKIAVHP